MFVFVFGLPLVATSTRSAAGRAFGIALGVLLHPRLFGPMASFLLRPLGAGTIPALTYRRTIQLLATTA